MIEIKGTVHMKDGSTLEFEGGPFERMLAEVYMIKRGLGDMQSAPQTASLYMAYIGVGNYPSTSGNDTAFLTWCRDVQEVELTTSEPDPTPPAALDG